MLRIGDEFPVSLKLPEQVSFDNFDLISIVPDVAKLVMAANPDIYGNNTRESCLW